MSKKIDINGFWEIKDNPLTKEGVFPYLGKQIDPNGARWGLDPDRIYWVYRSKKEISDPETLQSFENKPFIDEHVMLGEGCTPTDCKNIAGVIHNIRCKGNVMIGDFTIYSDDIKREIMNGKKQLSLGYRSSFDKKAGLFQGRAYDFIQVGMVGNHVALVGRGRCGSDVRIFDKSIVCDSLEIPQMAINKEELKSVIDTMDEATLAKAKEAIDSLKTPTQDEATPAADGDEGEPKNEPKTETQDGGTAAVPAGEGDEGEPKVETQDGAPSAEPKTEVAPAAKVETMDEAAVRKDAAIQARKAMSLHDRLVPHIGEFVMDEMFTENDVAVYGCKKLVEKGLIMDSDVNAGSELATLTGFLAGRKETSAKVVTVDAAPNGADKPAFDFRAAYLAK